ncbi:SusC/RagA family TonB-linked outer membrane protein [Sphingobacterium deserti]|uniref:TonB-dependent receptor plug n=1 Tax=Sphingobacterium deserti TaxID=1229276 RepID=A0A0B8SZV4_9SPHI|nr:TonB-dependent receptor [Sphingobacterium deserti]KGE13226.1 TonB-dependent receptor plug [Sphingobacterium deserti]
MVKRYVWLFIIICFQVSAHAQQSVKVRGKVTRKNGLPIAGATVQENGKAASTVTNKDGAYEIEVSSAGTLLFSFVGYTKSQENVSGRRIINVELQENENTMDEVVVIGYGQVQRKDLTGAVSSLKGEEIAKVPVQSVAQAMQGRLAGVQVAMSDGTPGAEPSIKIRGGTSITQSNEPLYVVDGIPQTEGLAFLDPMDVESVDVLKDASATAIYGAQGANGVVLVTTKRLKSSKLRINYDNYVGAKKITNEIAVMNPYQYTTLLYENALRDPLLLERFTANYGSFDSLQMLYGDRPGINWQRELFGQAVINQYHKVSINGGSNETKFNIFYALNDDEGLLKNSGSTKNIAKLTLNHNANNKFLVNGIINYSDQKITGMGTQEGGNARLSMLQTLLQYRPVIGRLGNDESLLDFETDPLDNPESPAFQSPLITVESQLRESISKALNANLTLQYNFSKKLNYKGLLGYTDRGVKSKQFNDARGIAALRSGGPFGSVSHNLYRRFNYNNTLNYKNTFADVHRLDVTLGQEYIYNYSEGLLASASVFPSVNLGWDNLGLGTVAGFPQTFAEDDKMLSFFARANYTYRDRYLFTGSLRADGSSKFGTENQWGIFPSAAVAWRVINEPFMKNLTAFSDLKLRLSYGMAGNNRIANYAALGIFTPGVYPLGNQVVAAAFQGNLPNPNLKWEAVESKNLGLDIGFLKQRLTLTAELYDNRSRDLLYNTRIPSSSGFVTQFQNIGTTSSRGLELTLNTTNINRNDFKWNSSFNIAFNRTKVLSLSDGETSLLTNSYTTISDYILEVGRPVGLMYGYQREGLYQVDDFNFDPGTGVYTLKDGVVKDNIAVQPGFIKFRDISGPDGQPDGLINEHDRTVIGNANPAYSGGLNNSFSYKGFDLSIFINFTVGHDIYNANVLNNANLQTEYANRFARFADRWTTIDVAGNRITDPVQLAAVNQGKTNPAWNGNNTGRLYDDIIEDGSFLRINNVSLGYTFPRSWVNKIKLSNLRVYCTAYNLHVFTKYSGYDPEVSVIRTALTPGVDFSAYPRAMSFVAGLNLSL